MERRLHRSRKEFRELELQRAQKKDELTKRARKALKDIRMLLGRESEQLDKKGVSHEGDTNSHVRMHGLTGGWNAPQEWLMALSLSIKKKQGSRTKFQNAARIQSVDAAQKKRVALREKEEFVEKTSRIVKTGEVTDALVQRVEKEQREAIKDLFFETDDDGSGLLDRSEVKQLAIMLGQKLNSKELDMAMAEMDEDGSGEVDFDEFFAWWVSDKEESALQMKEDGSSKYFEIVPYEQ